MHKSVTLKRVVNAVKRAQSSCENPGFCVSCGHKADGCEPDARGYECENCGKRSVYGVGELLMMIGD